ncbi:MAG: BON domain-containing protein [Actinomycetota bacterium]|nr:BON domain-containing protein [Actinomycetota bacterium]
MPKKRMGAKLGAKAGTRVAPRAGKLAGKAALRAGKGQARLARAAASPKEPVLSRFFKYGLFALAGLAIGSILARSRGGSDSSSSFTGTTGQHTPDPSSPAGQRGETWGSGTPTGSSGGGGVASEPAAPQDPEDPNRTGAEREYSDPSAGPLIGEHHRGSVAGVGESQPEAEQRIRTLIGEDPRTASMPRVNVEVIDGVAELRGPAPSQEAREAAGEIAAGVEGVTEVRNLIVVS